MKTSLKVIGAVFLLGMAILAGLHLFLQHGLAKTMREVVLPRLKQETGIDVHVGGLSLNLLRGILYIDDVAVRNPDGFLLENLASIDRIDVEVDLWSLLRNKLVLVRKIDVENAQINIVRNQEGLINLQQLGAGFPAGLAAPALPTPEQRPEARPPAPEAAPAEAPEPLPEALVQALDCKAKVRYVDLRLKQFDIALNLDVNGGGLSTVRDPAAPWGDLSIHGSLGTDRTKFVTDLKMRLAPVVDPQVPSFDLSGKVLEIDPRLLHEACDKLNIRVKPFGLEPAIVCRSGRFEDSSVALNLSGIEMENPLGGKKGGTISIGSLRFPVAVAGTLRQPEVDFLHAMYGALGSNSKGVLDAFLKGAAAKEAGLDKPPETLSDAAVETLASQVGELKKSETAKKVLKDLAAGQGSGTNAASQINSDTVVDLLGEKVDEIGKNKELKEDLKNLGKQLFGR